MNRVICLLLLAATALGAQQPAAPQASQPELRWKNIQLPRYPSIARSAHIFGEVKINLEVQPDGTFTIGEKTGHPLFQQAALDGLKQSQAECVNCAGKPATFTMVYEFKIEVRKDDPAKARNAPCPQPASNNAVQDSPTHITIMAQPPCILPSGPCPKQPVRSVRCLYLWRCKLKQFGCM